MFNFFLRHLGKSLAPKTLGVALSMWVLTAGQAQAFVVNVGGQNWNVTTFTGSYDDNTSKFATSANYDPNGTAFGVMPWWEGDSGLLAYEFATQVGSSLGLPYFAQYGPFFGFERTLRGVDTVAWWSISGSAFPGGSVDPNQQYVWAQANLVATAAPVPGPLPALGAAAAFGFSRQLRKRIKRSTNAVSSSCRL
jgi:hypothetical protein